MSEAKDLTETQLILLIKTRTETINEDTDDIKVFIRALQSKQKQKELKFQNTYTTELIMTEAQRIFLDKNPNFIQDLSQHLQDTFNAMIKWKSTLTELKKDE